jgi:hypothetical protein
VRWVSELDWIARRTVQLDRTDLDLIVTDLDTVVEILLGSSSSDIPFRKILLITGKPEQNEFSKLNPSCSRVF